MDVKSEIEYWKTQYRKEIDLRHAAEVKARAFEQKYLEEKDRRQQLSIKYIQLLGQTTDERRLPTSTNDQMNEPLFYDEHSLLSPTLKSFDFDDDEMSEENLTESHHDFVPVVSELVPEPRKRAVTLGALPGPENDSQSEASKMLMQMLHTHASFSDIWSLRSSKKSTHLSSVARAVRLSVRSRNESILEHFFISGVSPGMAEGKVAKETPDILTGHYRPKILYQYPGAGVTSVNEATIGEFCFPVGVPAYAEIKSVAEKLKGNLVSTWQIDDDSIARGKCYTFRLTGPKGEALYGFCAAQIESFDELHWADKHTPPQTLCLERYLSPRQMLAHCVDPAERATVVGHRKSLDRRFMLSPSRIFGRVEDFFRELSPSSSNKQKVLDNPSEEKAMITTRCYCITSKFPFYKLHFKILREVLAIMESSKTKLRVLMQSAWDSNRMVRTKDFEVVVASHGSLGLTLRRTTNEHEQDWKQLESIGIDSSHLSLSAISSPPIANAKGVYEMREDGYATTDKPLRRLRSNSWSEGRPTRSNGDQGNVIVKGFEQTGTEAPEWHQHIEIGDILCEINGKSISDKSFTETIRTLRDLKRPLTLRFHRLLHSDPRNDQQLINEAVEKEKHECQLQVEQLLKQYLRMEVQDPGQWSTIQLPSGNFSYQFPSENPERWSCSVAFRHLQPRTILKVLTCLLLERSLVIYSENTARLAAVATAFMTLLKPFEWQATFIPILPATLTEFIHSPVPFVVGTHTLCKVDEWPDVCFLGVDNDEFTPSIEARDVDESILPNGKRMAVTLTKYCRELCAVYDPSRPWHELTDTEAMFLDAAIVTLEQGLQGICGDVKQCYVPIESTDLSTPTAYRFLGDKYYARGETKKQHEFLKAFSETQLFYHYCDTIISSKGSVCH